MRPEHAALHGVTLPPSSPFWDSFMPPNGWNCRCTAVQVRRGKYPQTDIAEAMERGEAATADDKRGMMRFNPGKEQSVWPAYNPYTTTRCRDCDRAKEKGSFARTTPPENDMCAACRLSRQLSIEAGYTPHPKYGNRLLISNTADSSELEDNIRGAISILDAFPEKNIKIRPHVFIYKVPNPEYEIDGLIADRKGIYSEKGVADGFRKALEQGCEVVVLDLDKRMSKYPLRSFKLASKISNRNMDFESGRIKSCYIIYHGKAVCIQSWSSMDDLREQIEKLEP